MSEPMIPYGRQTVDEADIAAVVEVLRGDWLTQGPTVDRFEEELAGRVDARHAVAFSSGTAALHAAAAAAGVGPGDVLATSPLTFMASANCARYVGARVELIDIEEATFNIDLAKVRPNLAAIVPVHFAGLPVDLRTLSTRPGVIIEDAAHSLGAHTPYGPVGNCALSDMTEFSFHPVKAITTGEGGAITTNSDELADALRTFRSHGIVRMPERGGWYYEIDTIGFNYRMTDIQAALGLSQLDKLDSFVARRNEIAQRYQQLLADDPVGLPPTAPAGFSHAYHLFPIRVEQRSRVFDGLRANGVGVQVHYVPIHHHPISADIGLKPGDLPVCDLVYEQLISLPMYPGLSDQDQDRVVATLRSLLET